MVGIAFLLILLFIVLLTNLFKNRYVEIMVVVLWHITFWISIKLFNFIFMYMPTITKIIDISLIVVPLYIVARHFLSYKGIFLPIFFKNKIIKSYDKEILLGLYALVGALLVKFRIKHAFIYSLSIILFIIYSKITNDVTVKELLGLKDSY